MQKQPVKIIQQNTLYEGFIRLRSYQLQHPLFLGGMSAILSRELLERPCAVSVLLYDPSADTIVMIEQIRIGALIGGAENPWLLELVAGVIEPNEHPQNVALRETQEETGLTVEAIIPICSYWLSPGISTERVFLFCAQVDSSDAGGIHGLDKENEDIRVQVFPANKAYDLLQEGRTDNAMTIIALQWFVLNKKHIAQQLIQAHAHE